ncbi:hypothetical protein K458DRAFT_37896 [Lentithecium fluviatile CBS 122367]|uniref:Uncharacterized protein n=1 Tax=Lentithecium fluviatile CBS 122367 TaxID=1168545 RepID=A0A6G1J0S3_9PLEO|nr:hypothetical protein K458DRAFT_37896 [Lentithecium fluviatile CBS 122367]
MPAERRHAERCKCCLRSIQASKHIRHPATSLVSPPSCFHPPNQTHSPPRAPFLHSGSPVPGRCSRQQPEMRRQKARRRSPKPIDLPNRAPASVLAHLPHPTTACTPSASLRAPSKSTA